MHVVAIGFAARSYRMNIKRIDTNFLCGFANKCCANGFWAANRDNRPHRRTEHAIK